MNKKIIFIGGTSRSGTTLLDLILANDNKGMSLGEIHYLFHPIRKHNFSEIEKLNKDEIWSKILKDGKKNLYQNLIKCFPQIDIFVDSSKDPFWFKYHEKVKTSNYEIKYVLIFKTPEELAESFIKRGKKSEWIRTYVHYHKKYFSLIKNFNIISYKDLVTNDIRLKILCEKIGIKYFEKKKNYWERPQPTFFGSNSVRSYNSQYSKSQLTEIRRFAVNYKKINDEEIINYVNTVLEKNPEVLKMKNVLMNLNEIYYNNQKIDDIINDKSLIYNKLYLGLIKLKNTLRRKYMYYFPEDYFRKL